MIGVPSEDSDQPGHPPRDPTFLRADTEDWSDLAVLRSPSYLSIYSTCSGHPGTVICYCYCCIYSSNTGTPLHRVELYKYKSRLKRCILHHPFCTDYEQFIKQFVKRYNVQHHIYIWTLKVFLIWLQKSPKNLVKSSQLSQLVDSLTTSFYVDLLSVPGVYNVHNEVQNKVFYTDTLTIWPPLDSLYSSIGNNSLI